MTYSVRWLFLALFIVSSLTQGQEPTAPKDKKDDGEKAITLQTMTQSVLHHVKQVDLTDPLTHWGLGGSIFLFGASTAWATWRRHHNRVNSGGSQFLSTSEALSNSEAEQLKKEHDEVLKKLERTENASEREALTQKANLLNSRRNQHLMNADAAKNFRENSYSCNWALGEMAFFGGGSLIAASGASMLGYGVVKPYLMGTSINDLQKKKQGLEIKPVIQQEIKPAMTEWATEQEAEKIQLQIQNRIAIENYLTPRARALADVFIQHRGAIKHLLSQPEVAEIRKKTIEQNASEAAAAVTILNDRANAEKAILAALVDLSDKDISSVRRMYTPTNVKHKEEVLNKVMAESLKKLLPEMITDSGKVTSVLNERILGELKTKTGNQLWDFSNLAGN